jgi:hypothetical protein
METETIIVVFWDRMTEKVNRVLKIEERDREKAFYFTG